MENGSQKIGLRVAAGVLVAITIIVAVFASGITLPGQEAKTGRLNVFLIDKPVEVDELWITVEGIDVHKVGEDEIDDDAGWEELTLSTFEKPLKFDLLRYQGGELMLDAASGQIGVGEYNKIRIFVSEATAEYYLRNDDGDLIDTNEIPILEGGTPEIDADKTQLLTVPPNHIDVITKFTIDDIEDTTIIIDMQPDMLAISNSSRLNPTLKVITGGD